MSNTVLAGLLEGLVSNAVLDGTDFATPVDTADLALDLFDYQDEAVAHVFRDPTKRYGYVGLDMGLGKTPVGIAVAVSIVAKFPGTKVLLVVPPSLRFNWKREFEKFAPDAVTHTITTSKPAEGEGVPEADIIVIGDSSLRGEGKGDKYKPTGWTEMLAGKVDHIVVDEMHRFKNDTARSASLVWVADRAAGYKVGMSGTMAPNGRNVEIARQVEFMGKSAWEDIGGKGLFYTRYAPIVDPTYGSRESTYGEELNASMSDTWYFRRLRDDVQDLPNKGRTVISIEGEGKAKREYLKAEEDLIDYLRGAEKNFEFNSRAEALVKMTTLRRLAGVARIKGVADHVKDILDEVPGGVFIVAEHGEVIDGLMNKLLKYNPVTIRGGMTDAQKAEAVDLFTSGESRVMVGQIIAAGVGLTLHGGGQNHRVVVAQIPWTPADLRQAEDRLHRYGQTNDVLVEVTACAIPECDKGWTIDERLWGKLEAKAYNAGQLQDGEGSYLLEEVQDSLLDSYR